MSNLRVSVKWQNTAVFAGESVECVITFRNVAEAFDSKSSTTQVRNNDTTHDVWKDTSTAANVHQTTAYSPRRSSNATFTKGHRTAASSSRFSSRTSSAAGAGILENRQPGQATTNERHKRSVSIVSIGGSPTSPENKTQGIAASTRPGRGHGRAASLQILPGRSTVPVKGPNSALRPLESSASTRRYSQASTDGRAATAPAIPRSSTSPSSGITAAARELQMPVGELAITSTLSVPHSRTPSAGFIRSSKISQILPSPVRTVKQTRDGVTSEPFYSTTRSQAPMQDRQSQVLDARSYLTEVFSSMSNEGTPRSSTDFYPNSNNSSDTLASDYVNADVRRTSHQSILGKERSQPSRSKPHRIPEILMMGYGNIVGNFNLDASLVNSSPFDEVKRKAVIGNQGGGGVVRAGSTKRQSGLLGSFGWNALGESLGGLLGSNEMSSIKEATNSNEAKWFPILSTPQSLLFTDLHLEPGQSRSYSFSYRLPPGLPPSYKGKALKVSYNIVIGVQRATQSTQRHIVRSVDFPFRVLPSVNGYGDTIGHDLMSPRVMLHSEPLIGPINDFKSRATATTRIISQPESSYLEQGFLSYINHLLDMPSQDPSGGLLSPSATESLGLENAVEEPGTVESTITLAIQQSNSSMPSKLSANRFEITRSGNRVAVIMIARPAYRLGEVIPITVDFHDSDIRCYSLRVTLETSEHIDPTIALRSQASISRISRKIHAIQHSSCISVERVSFGLAIPNNSTPEFITSGISLDWCLRCEFVTGTQDDDEQGIDGSTHGLLEEVAEDERGTVLAAIQAMPCETFDVQLPLRVYGDKNSLDDSHRIQESPI